MATEELIRQRVIQWFANLASTMEAVATEKGYKLRDGTDSVRVTTDRDVRSRRSEVCLSIPDELLPFLAEADFIASKGVKDDDRVAGP